MKDKIDDNIKNDEPKKSDKNILDRNEQISLALLLILVGAIIFTNCYRSVDFSPAIKTVQPQETASFQSTVTIGTSEAESTTKAESKTDNTAASSKPESGLININTATVTELMTLYGIGESKANKIIEYRDKFGDFKYPEDIMNVSGIGEKTYEKIKDDITVE